MGSPIEAKPETWMNGGPIAASSEGRYSKPRLEGAVWFTCSSKRNRLRRKDKRPSATREDEKVWVSVATKFWARCSSPTGNPGTLAPDVESGSRTSPWLKM